MAGMALMTAGSGGGGVATVTLNYQSVIAVFGGTATAAYRIDADGSVYQSINGGAYTVLETWCTPASQASNYECFATLSSGSLTSGTTGSWLALSTDRTWTRQATSGLNFSAELSIVIRRIGDTALAAGPTTIDLEAYSF